MYANTLCSFFSLVRSVRSVIFRKIYGHFRVERRRHESKIPNDKEKTSFICVRAQKFCIHFKMFAFLFRSLIKLLENTTEKCCLRLLAQKILNLFSKDIFKTTTSIFRPNEAIRRPSEWCELRRRHRVTRQRQNVIRLE